METIDVLKGKTLINIQVKDDEEILFVCSDGKRYLMYHEQECCESVTIEEIIGDLDNLLNTPLIMAECVSNESEENNYGSETWTFYKLGTNKGFVTIRWYGESNGYYSESIDFKEIINMNSEIELDKRICDVEEDSENEQTFREYIRESEETFELDKQDIDKMDKKD